jgi:hypothetical protein
MNGPGSSWPRASSHAGIGAFVLALSVLAFAISMVVYQAWWTASFVAFGMAVLGLARRRASLEATIAVSVAIAGSLLAIGFGAFLAVISQSGNRAPCPQAGPCNDASGVFLVGGLGLIVLGVVGLVASARWLRRTRE